MEIPVILPTGYSQTISFVLVARGDKSIAQIAHALKIEYGSAHVTLHRLVKKGLVKRDGHVFTLTDAGHEVKSFFLSCE